MNSTGTTRNPVSQALGWALSIILYSFFIGLIYSFFMVFLFFGDSYEPMPETGVYHKTVTIARTFGIRWVPSPKAMWIGLVVTLILAWISMSSIWLVQSRNNNQLKRQLFNYKSEYHLLTKSRDSK